MKKPDDREEDKGGGADKLGVGANNVSKHLKFTLEGSKLLLDSESILVRVLLERDLTLLQGVLAHSEDNSLSRATHNNGVLEEDHVRVFLDVFFF